MWIVNLDPNPGTMDPDHVHDHRIMFMIIAKI